jgi:hypothetical protein
MSPNAGEGGVAGSQPKSTVVHRSPNQLWRSNSIPLVGQVSKVHYIRIKSEVVISYLLENASHLLLSLI